MHAYTTAGWGELFLAEAGASAALAGLLFVAISINLTKILEVRGHVGRAGEAIVLLVAVLIVSTLVLVPDQPRATLGVELLVAGLLAWSILVGIHAKAVRGRVGPSRAVLAGRIAMAQVAVLPFPVAGASLLQAGGGPYWLVVGVVFFGGRGVQRLGAAHRDPEVRDQASVRCRSCSLGLRLNLAST